MSRDLHRFTQEVDRRRAIRRAIIWYKIKSYFYGKCWHCTIRAVNWKGECMACGRNQPARSRLGRV